MSGWIPTIGLEVHVQLGTASKLFCGCAAEFGAPPNTRVCPVCAGLPGVLPMLNRRAVELAVRAGLALECAIPDVTHFDRKHYFYPDLPKGYQISQFDRPICGAGRLRIDAPDGGTKMVRVRRAHLEEDAGKLIHDRVPGASCVDLNRAGVPLIEIVTEPDLDSAEEAHAYLTELKRTLIAAGVSECDMERGSLRCDANVSIRPAGTDALGERNEIKNLNSFRNVKRAIEHEIARQIALREAGGTVELETRLWDAERGTSRVMRSKEEAHDYRYFPDPDLPPLAIDAAWVDTLRAAQPELPRARRARYTAELGLSAYDAGVLADDPVVAELFEATAARTGDAKRAANWVMGEVMALANTHAAAGGFAALQLDAERLAELIDAVEGGVISANQGKAVLAEMVLGGETAAAIIDARGLRQDSDPEALAALAAAVVAAHPGSLEDYRNGMEQKAVGFLMGQLMQRSGGRANPRLARAALEQALEAGR
ncbi:MAG: Asp-tRNA(Asn)/Glu-tRNA(Gln) amidotransferase subunit GatB [Planctomycetota bacterium]